MTTLEKLAKGFVKFEKGMQITDKEKEIENSFDIINGNREVTFYKYG